MKLILKQVVELLYNLFMAFRSLFWKRDEGVVLFGAWFGNRFADNSRFLYQYLSSNKEKLNLSHVVWVSRSSQIVNELKQQGYEAYLMDSKESIYFHKISKYHFICESCNNIFANGGDILTQYSYGANRINLWHGVGAFKLVNYSVINNLSSRTMKLKKWLKIHSSFYRFFMEESGGWGNFKILSSSPEATRQWKDFFAIEDAQCIETNIPRNCQVIRLLEREKEVIEIIKDYKYVVIYVPTFRETNTISHFKPNEDLKSQIKIHNILIIEKSHSFDSTWITTDSFNDNVMTLDPSFDINILMPYVSSIITDFSSIAVDGLYREIPVLFYIPDYFDYKKNDRGFVDNISERFFSKIIQDEDVLCNEIVNSCLNPCEYLNETYYKEKKKWWSHDDYYLTIWNKIKTAFST